MQMSKVRLWHPERYQIPAFLPLNVGSYPRERCLSEELRPATCLTNLRETCDLNETTGNKHRVRLYKYQIKRQRYFHHGNQAGNRDTCKTCSPLAEQWDTDIAHVCESALYKN